MRWPESPEVECSRDSMGILSLTTQGGLIQLTLLLPCLKQKASTAGARLTLWSPRGHGAAQKVGVCYPSLTAERKLVAKLDASLLIFSVLGLICRYIDQTNINTACE